MLDSLNTILKIFHRKPLKGWVIDEPESPKWWGGLSSPEEIVISAILVQLTRWENVEKALENLRKRNLLDLKKLSDIDEIELQKIIKPVGLRRLKARRLIELSKKVTEIGGLVELRKMDVEEVRSFLKSINGIGRETADAITLFALNKPTIPISEYVKRVLGRVFSLKETDYETLRKSILEHFRHQLYSLKLFYAGVTTIGKYYCKKQPKCYQCPLNCLCETFKLIQRKY